MKINEGAADREQTDESLRMEREKTDHALAERQAAEEDSDLVVHRARESADAVLTEARAKADERLEASPHVGAHATLAEARRGLRLRQHLHGQRDTQSGRDLLHHHR